MLTADLKYPKSRARSADPSVVSVVTDTAEPVEESIVLSPPAPAVVVVSPASAAAEAVVSIVTV